MSMRTYLLQHRSYYYPDNGLWSDFVMLYEKTVDDINKENMAKQGLVASD